MDSGADFLWLLNRMRESQRSFRDLTGVLVAELQNLGRSHPGEARRLTLTFLKEHDRALASEPEPLQMSLFPNSVRRPTLRVVKRNVVTIGVPYLLDEYPRSCPGCRQRLIERSRVGDRVYYTCASKGCGSERAIFIGLLGTGDE
jgi:hypothetical protein